MLREKLLNRLFPRQARPEKDAMGVLERFQRARGGTVALQSYLVDGPDPDGVAFDEQKGRPVLRHASQSAHEGVLAHCHEVMDGSEPAETGMTFHAHVPAEE